MKMVQLKGKKTIKYKLIEISYQHIFFFKEYNLFLPK